MTLQKFLEDQGFETRSYSGRGMFSRTCLAVEGISLFELGYLIGSCEDQFEYDRGMAAPKVDQMGKSEIIYFPFIPFESEEE